MIEDKRIKDLQALWEDAEKQVKRRTRRIIAIILVICLAFGLLGFVCGRASASAGDVITFNNDTFDTSGWRMLYSTVHDYLVEHSDEGWDYMILGKVDAQWSGNPYTYSITISQYPIRNMGGQMEVYLSEIGSPLGVRGFYYESLTNTVKNLSYSSVGSTQYGYRYYPANYPNIGSYSYGQFWSSHANDICPANLIVPEFLPPADNRIFTVSKVIESGNTYIKFEAFPLEDYFTFYDITFYCLDSQGNDFTDIVWDSDFDELRFVGSLEYESDGLVGLLNPTKISIYQYTIYKAEIHTLDSEYGNKTLLGLNLTFNESLFPPSSNYNDYTSYNYYEYFSSLDSMAVGPAPFYIGTSNYGPGFYYWSSDHFIERQPFELKTICLPDLLHNISETRMFQLYETYDLIVTGCNEDIIDSFYGDIGFYDSLTGSESSIVPLCMEHTVDARQLWNDYTGTVVYSDSNCGLFLTRNGLLKQISYFCGDTSGRLLEFETRLVDSEDGVLTTIQKKLSESYEQNNSFFNAVLPAIQNLSYALNGLDFGVLASISDKLDRIIGYFDFDINIDLSKLSSPWKDIFQIGKGMFDSSEFMWEDMIPCFNTLKDGYEALPNYSTNVLLPDITGPVPLLPSIAPVPLLPELSPVPTLIPIFVGGG